MYAKNTVATSERLREDVRKFRKLLRQFVEHYQPVDPVHALLVEDFASLTWWIARVVRTKTKLVLRGEKVMTVTVHVIGRDPVKPEEPDKPKTVPSLPLLIEGIDALGRQEDRLRRHWLRLYHELERRRSLTLGEPIPPRPVAELE